MPQIANNAAIGFFASCIAADKPHQLETPEGYRVYLGVPVARTGVQKYLGSELKQNPGYQQEWNLNDDEFYDVYRPVEEVTSPETLASFEGKSVVDGHPPGEDLLLYPEIDAKYNRGHGQNVRLGELLPNGETPVLADLVVKSPELNDKIDGGLREVSCGYTYMLAKDGSGRLVQTSIRGNHFAVVREGRAGSHIAIQDAVPPETAKESLTVNEKLKLLFGRMLQAFAKDAKPEEVAEAAQLMPGAAADAEPEDKKAEEEKAEKKESKDKKAKDCKGAKDASAKLEALKKLLDEFFTEEESEPAHAADAEPEKLEEIKEKKAGDEAEKKDDEEKSKKEGDEAEKVPMGKSATGDSADFLRKLAPMVAKSKDKAIIAAYNAKVRALNSAISDGKDEEDPFAALVQPKTGATKDATPEPEPPMTSFFNGVPYSEGLRKFNEYQANKAKGAK